MQTLKWEDKIKTPIRVVQLTIIGIHRIIVSPQQNVSNIWTTDELLHNTLLATVRKVFLHKYEEPVALAKTSKRQYLPES